MDDKKLTVVPGTHTVKRQTTRKSPPKRRDPLTRLWRGLVKFIGIIALLLSPWPIFNGGGTPFYVWGTMLFGGLFCLGWALFDYYVADPLKAKRMALRIVASIIVAWLVHHFWPTNHH